MVILQMVWQLTDIQYGKLFVYALYVIIFFFCLADLWHLTDHFTCIIGVILDTADPRAGTINRSIDLAMRVTNGTRSAKMHPVRNITDYNDCFKIEQTCKSLISGF